MACLEPVHSGKERHLCLWDIPRKWGFKAMNNLMRIKVSKQFGSLNRGMACPRTASKTLKTYVTPICGSSPTNLSYWYQYNCVARRPLVKGRSPPSKKGFATPQQWFCNTCKTPLKFVLVHRSDRHPYRALSDGCPLKYSVCGDMAHILYNRFL